MKIMFPHSVVVCLKSEERKQNERMRDRGNTNLITSAQIYFRVPRTRGSQMKHNKMMNRPTTWQYFTCICPCMLEMFRTSTFFVRISMDSGGSKFVQRFFSLLSHHLLQCWRMFIDIFQKNEFLSRSDIHIWMGMKKLIEHCLSLQKKIFFSFY